MSLWKIISKSSIFFNILIILIILYIISFLYSNMNYEIIENMENNTSHFNNSNIYDEFYSSIYDPLFYSKNKDDFEVHKILKHTKFDKNSYVLDIGCGTGNHVYEFSQKNIKAIGFDKSPHMINVCNKKFPELDFKEGDALNTLNFNEETFSHITSLYFTIYYIQNKRLFFQNCFQWLKPGGYLVLHLVNRSMFDPIIPPSNPLLLVSPQKYAKERITNSIVKFNNYDYNANFEIKDSKGFFTEEFKQKNSKHPYRINKHHLYMETQKEILGAAKDFGFVVFAKTNMTPCQYEYNYIYFLQKPF